MTEIEYYSFERVLMELQMEENELKKLISEGKMKSFEQDGKIKFKKRDIDNIKKIKMNEPTLKLPPGKSH